MSEINTEIDKFNHKLTLFILQEGRPNQGLPMLGIAAALLDQAARALAASVAAHIISTDCRECWREEVAVFDICKKETIAIVNEVLKKSGSTPLNFSNHNQDLVKEILNEEKANTTNTACAKHRS